jgi:uncharacterized membrane protein
MNSGLTLLLAFGIGVVAGLRSLTAPAVVSWAAYSGWIHLTGSPLAFMGSKWSVGIFTILALLELVADQLPSTPPRTGAMGLSARVVTGALTGAALAVAGGGALWMGAVFGAIGGVVGAFAGYHARVGLVRGLRIPDFAIALPEDAIAIGLGLFLTSRF